MIKPITSVVLLLLTAETTFAQSDDYSVTPLDLTGIVVPVDSSNMPYTLIPVLPPDLPPPDAPLELIFVDPPPSSASTAANISVDRSQFFGGAGVSALTLPSTQLANLFEGIPDQLLSSGPAPVAGVIPEPEMAQLASLAGAVLVARRLSFRKNKQQR